MPRKRHPTLQEAQQAAVDAGERFLDRQDDLRPWDVKLVGHAKRWTKILAAVAGLASVAGTAVTGIVKAWRFARAGGATPPAELPATHQPTIATDHVERPTPPRP